MGVWLLLDGELMVRVGEIGGVVQVGHKWVWRSGVLQVHLVGMDGGGRVD